MKIIVLTFLILGFHVWSQPVGEVIYTGEKEKLFGMHPAILDIQNEGFVIKEETQFVKFNNKGDLEWKSDPKIASILYEGFLKYKDEFYYYAIKGFQGEVLYPALYKITNQGGFVKINSEPKVSKGYFIGYFLNAQGVNLLFYTGKTKGFQLYTYEPSAQSINLKEIALSIEDQEVREFAKKSSWKGWNLLTHEDKVILSKVRFLEEESTLVAETVEIDENNKASNHVVRKKKIVEQNSFTGYDLKLYYNEQKDEVYAICPYSLKGTNIYARTGTFLISFPHNSPSADRLNYAFNNVKNEFQNLDLKGLPLSYNSYIYYDSTNNIFRLYSIIEKSSKTTIYRSLIINDKGKIVELAHNSIEESAMRLSAHFNSAGKTEVLYSTTSKLKSNPFSYIEKHKITDPNYLLLSYLENKAGHFFVFYMNRKTGEIFACKDKY